MPSRHRIENKLSHVVDREVDIKGTAVALAFLVSIGVFAGGRDSRTVSEDQQTTSSSMQIAQPLTIEKTETLQHSDDEADRSEASRTFNVSR